MGNSMLTFRWISYIPSYKQVVWVDQAQPRR
jgi:hypothetical protein